MSIGSYCSVVWEPSRASQLPGHLADTGVHLTGKELLGRVSEGFISLAHFRKLNSFCTFPHYCYDNSTTKCLFMATVVLCVVQTAKGLSCQTQACSPRKFWFSFFVLASLEKGSRRQEPHWIALSGLDIKGL